MSDGIFELTPRKKEIWAIGGGKGGTGKSIIIASLGMMLATLNKNKKIILVDADLGTPNLHTYLDLKGKRATISEFILKPKEFPNLSDIISETNITNLKLISGDDTSLGMDNLLSQQKIRLIKGIKSLDADYILIDLSAGVHFNTLDFALAADKIIIDTIPDKASIIKAFSFIKNIMFRIIVKTIQQENQQEIIELINTEKKNNKKEPWFLVDLIQEIEQKNKEFSKLLKEKWQRVKFKLILNKAEIPSERMAGVEMSLLCRQLIGVKMDYVGYLLEYQDRFKQITKRHKPLAPVTLGNDLTNYLENIIKNIIEDKSLTIEDIGRPNL